MTWRILYCQTGQELSANAEFAGLSIEAFCPFERLKRHKAVRGTTQIRWINSPLFPGYLFVNSDNFLDFETVKGVISVVKFGKRPLAVPERVLSALRSIADPTGLVRSEDLTRNSYSFKAQPGDRFTFKSTSPFSGIIGRIASLARLDETGEISAWIESFGREVEVRLHYSTVSKVLEAKPQAA